MNAMLREASCLHALTMSSLFFMLQELLLYHAQAQVFACVMLY